MPGAKWHPEKHTKKAKTAKRKRQWRHVADSVLKKTGDEGRAVRAANAVVGRRAKKRKTKKNKK